jgi:hypothetical protein
MTDKEVANLVKKMLTIIRTLHTELRAHENVLLHSGHSPQSISAQTKKAKKIPAVDRGQYYNELAKKFDSEVTKIGVGPAAKALLKRIRLKVR